MGWWNKNDDLVEGMIRDEAERAVGGSRDEAEAAREKARREYQDTPTYEHERKEYLWKRKEAIDRAARRKYGPYL